MADLNKFLQQYYFLATRLDEISAYPLDEQNIYDPKDKRNQAWHAANNQLLKLIESFKPDKSPEQLAMHESLKRLKKRIKTLLKSYEKGKQKHVH